MGNVLDLAEVVAQDVDHVAPAHAALAASWFSLVPMSAINDFLGEGGDGEK